jgi:hypothetical protein
MINHTVFELRRYRLQQGERETLIDLFDREFLETQEAAGMGVLGQFRDLDDPDSLVWVRSFANMDTRAGSLSDFYGGPVWKMHGPAANATMLNSDNILLLRPVGSDSIFAASDRERPGKDALAIPPGLITVTICSLAPNTEEQFAAKFERSARPLLEKAGARIDATFVTERSANSFPRLPVLEGETVFVWFSSFANERAYAKHLAALSSSKDWTNKVFPELDRQLWRPMEVTRLTPTARSLHSW